MHIIAAKIYKKDLKLWLKSSAWLKNLMQELTAMLTPYTVSMMSHDDRCFVCEGTGHFGHHYSNEQCYGCDEFGHFAQDCPNKIPPSRTPCHKDLSHSRIDIPTSKGPDHTPSIMVPDMGGILVGHNPATVPTKQEQQPPQQLALLFGWWMPPLPLAPWHIKLA